MLFFAETFQPMNAALTFQIGLNNSARAIRGKFTFAGALEGFWGIRTICTLYLMPRCAAVDKLERYRYTRWNAACPGRFDGDNLSWYESNKRNKQRAGTHTYQISILQYFSLTVGFGHYFTCNFVMNQSINQFYSGNVYHTIAQVMMII